MKVIVCGGAGFIGSHLVDRLIKTGNKVCVIDNLSAGKKEYVNPKAKFYQVDVCDLQEVGKIFKAERTEYVVYEVSHVCWEEDRKNVFKDVSSNIIGLLNILNCCVKNSVKKIIYGSTIAVYGSSGLMVVTEDAPIKLDNLPLSAYSYALTKRVGELYILHYNRIHNLPYTILRYSHVYGPRQTSKGEVISRFAQDFMNQKPIFIYGDGTQGRDFIYAEDVVDATVLALKRGDNKTINIGSGRLTTINDLFEVFKSILNSNAKIHYVKARQGEQKGVFMDIKVAKRTLLWEPKIGLNGGIKRTLTYFKDIDQIEY